MISDIDYIHNDVADIKAEMRTLVRLVEYWSEKSVSLEGICQEIQQQVDITGARVVSIVEKLIDKNAIYPDIDNA